MNTCMRIAAFLLFVCPAAADWPNFRGPNHDGISSETGFAKTWDAKLPLLWERQIGDGFSSFACVGDRVYTCGTQDDEQVLYCLNADTGAVIWQTPIEESYLERQGGDGPRATPTVDDGRIYILGARGTLLCVDANTGKIIWRKRFQHRPQWGYSGSVLIEGNLAIATGGESDGALAAFDKVTGNPVWTCSRDLAGYATPYPFTFEGTRYIAGFTGNAMLIAEAKTGRMVWRQPWKTDWHVNAASPIFHDGHLFVTSGYFTGCGLFRLRKDGDKIAADEVWRSKVLKNKFQSCILHEGHLYSSDQRALVCVDFLTGQERWREHRQKHGTIVLADKHLLVLAQDGTLRVGPADPQGFSPTATAKLLSGRCWTVPVLNNGKLYVRNLKRMACFDMRKR